MVKSIIKENVKEKMGRKPIQSRMKQIMLDLVKIPIQN